MGDRSWTVVPDQGARTFTGEWSCKKIPLCVVTGERLEPAELLTGLDALGDDLQLQIVGQRDDHAHHFFAVTVHRTDEGAVDLHGPYREVDQIRQRRVARTEVVDTQLDAERADPGESLLCAGGVGHEGALADLQPQARFVDTR